MRKIKLKNKLENEINSKTIDVNKLMLIIDDYTKNNDNLIEKLQRDKQITIKRINGGLKQTINAHGNITKELIGSASKRIYGNLLSNTKTEKKFKISIKSLLIGILIGVTIAIFI